MPIFLTQTQIDQISAKKLAGPNAQGNLAGGDGNNANWTAKLRRSKPCYKQQVRQRALHRTRNADGITQRDVLFSSFHRTDIRAMQAGLERQRLLRPAQGFALATNGKTDTFLRCEAFVHPGIGTGRSL